MAKKYGYFGNILGCEIERFPRGNRLAARKFRRFQKIRAPDSKSVIYWPEPAAQFELQAQLIVRIDIKQFDRVSGISELIFTFQGGSNRSYNSFEANQGKFQHNLGFRDFHSRNTQTLLAAFKKSARLQAEILRVKQAFWDFKQIAYDHSPKL